MAYLLINTTRHITNTCHLLTQQLFFFFFGGGGEMNESEMPMAIANAC